MPEGVGVDVGQSMPLAEPVQPSVDRIRMHGRPVIPGEQKTAVLVVPTPRTNLLGLPFLIFFQQCHGLRRQCNGSLGPLSLRVYLKTQKRPKKC